jgi:hypothetical protein
MEKTFQLDQKEQSMLAQVEQERTQALAAVGALSLDMEQARKNLDTAAERQRTFIRQILSNRGVERFENAGIRNGALVVSMPDPAAAPPLSLDGRVPERVNGPIEHVKE